MAVVAAMCFVSSFLPSCWERNDDIILKKRALEGIFPDPTDTAGDYKIRDLTK